MSELGSDAIAGEQPMGADAGPDGATDAGGTDATSDGMPGELIVAGHRDWMARGSAQDLTASACSGLGPESCVRPAAALSASLPLGTSCVGLAIRDQLDVFRWRCVEAVKPPRLEVVGFQPGRGLAHLLDASGWKPNAVEVRDAAGALLFRSTPSVFFDSRVVPAPPNPGSGVLSLVHPTPDGRGTIYVVTGQQQSSGYELAADGVALVVLVGGRLSYDDTAGPNCNAATASRVAADSHCLVFGAGRRNLWIEGALSGGTRGIHLANSRYLTLRRIDLRATASDGVSLLGIHHSEIVDLHQQGAGGVGVLLSAGLFNRFVRVAVANNRGDAGFKLRGAFGKTGEATGSYNTIVSLRAVNNSGRGGVIFDCGAHYNSVVDLLTAGNAPQGLWFVCNNGSNASHVTAINNGGAGVHFDQNAGNRGAQLLVVNNGGSGLVIDFGANDSVVAQLVSGNNGGYGVTLDAQNARFEGALVLGSNGAGTCRVVGRSSPGLLDGTCTVSGSDGSADYGPEKSTAVLRLGRGVAAGLVGKVVVDDPSCAFDLQGLAANVDDWWMLTAGPRFFGNDGDPFPSANNRQRCTANCRIWDARIDPLGPLAERSGNGDSNNPPLVGGQPCPSYLRGTVTMSDRIRREDLTNATGNQDGYCDAGETCLAANTYLINAVEIVGDGVGDDDGLCESFEHCFYSPHFGAWQGEGSGAGAECVFDDDGGPVQGVRIFARTP